MSSTFISTWVFGKLCVETAASHWNEHHDLLGCVEAGVAAVELDPSVTSVGLGGYPNTDGEIELDAAMMRGDTLQAGAVASMRSIVPAVSVARLVMERTPHLMLAGLSAQQFAVQNGMKKRPLLTPLMYDEYKKWLQKPKPPRVDWSVQDPKTADSENHDTVCLIAFHEGKFVVGTATSGMAWKLPGRVGDTPIVGAGLYADDQAGAAAATGHGEELWRFAISYRIVSLMRDGLNASEACEKSLREMIARKPENAQTQCAVIAIDKQGRTGAASTTSAFSAPTMIGSEFDPRPVEALGGQ